MQKKRVKLRYLFILVTSVAVASILIVRNSSALKKDLKVSNNILLSSSLNKANKPIKKHNYSGRPQKLHSLKDVKFSFEGQPIVFDNEIFEEYQRYYLPLNKISSLVGGYYYLDNSIINISYNNVHYKLNKNVYSANIENGTSFQLRGEVILKNNEIYLSLSDLENIFNLDDNWDYNTKHISLFKSKIPVQTPKNNSSGVAALIRFEDVAAGEVMLKSDNLKKMKIIADYFYSEGIKFNVGWIPRYKEPLNGVDNNLLEVSCIQNAQFINMLDYLIFKGGVIGVHGYTHQHGNEESVSGTELDSKHYNDVESTTKIVQASLDVANKLNIPISFFETPHYAATELQQSVIENYFDYIYEPCIGIWNKTPVVSPRNKTTIYVPTPLGYIPGTTAKELIDEIDKRPSGTLASFFYHPAKEFRHISLYDEEDGYTNYTYSGQSPMHEVVKALKDKGYKTIHINEIK